MWVIVAATALLDRVRIAQFSSEELALNYLNKSKCKKNIFSPESLLKDCCWAKVVYEENIPIDPVL
jgi:hypothetical protein